MNGAGQGSDAPVITRWIGRLHGTEDALHAPEPFVLAGIDWQGPEHARIELRARRVGAGWTPWLAASTLGHDTDGGETIAHALVGEPIWTGVADALQLRSAEPVEGISLHLVRAAAVAATQPDPLPPRQGGAAGVAQALPLALPRLAAGPGQPPIIARSAWAEKLLPRHAPLYGDVLLAFVHHSVNGNGYTAEQVPAMLRSIYMFHTYARGWNDFGYNFAVDAYGRVWEGRAGGIDRPVVGAQAGGYNSESFGVVLLGDFAATLPTAAAQRSLARLIAWKLALHGVPVEGRGTVEVDPSDAYYTPYRKGQHVSLPRIAAHRDGCTTNCPGQDMYVNGMPPLRRAVARLIGTELRLTLVPGQRPGPAGSAGTPNPAPGSAGTPYSIVPGTAPTPATTPASYLRLQAATVSAGEQLWLHGYLTDLAGRPRAGAPITLQQLGAARHEDPETELAVTVTQPNGLWVAVIEPRSNMLLRALHAVAPAAVSPLMLAGVTPDITLTVAPVEGGAQLLGTVMPPKAHVLIEVRAGAGKRHIVKRASVDAASGAFATTMELAPGDYSVVARAPADASTMAGASAPVSVQI